MSRASVIISTYNNVRAITLVLKSLELQTCQDFEVILADDGSSELVKSELEKIISKSKLEINHVWHPDNGWQKNIILNNAIRSSKNEYLIFIDGDCLLHKEFVGSHLAYAQTGVILTGRRVNLSKRVSDKLTPSRIEKGYLGSKILLDLVKDVPKKAVRDLEQGVYAGESKFGNWLNRKEKGVLGSNFSLYKSDILKVNGFDERFTEPAAGEDTDIEARLRRLGMEVKTVRNRAIQYHIFHKELPRKPARLKYLEENDLHEVSYTPYGLNKNKEE
jgi:glycosyltransferase involved in cell wall biosynthesis